LFNKDILQVEIGDFAGPLDLLCNLVENKEIQVSSIRVSDLVDIYSRYLMETKDVPLGKVAEIFALVSKILLMKIKALFPDKSSQDQCVECQESIENFELEDVLRQYKPYRFAAYYLKDLKDAADKCYSRLVERPLEDGSAVYVVGDLYNLSLLWLKLYLKKKEMQYLKVRNADKSGNTVFETVPEEVQVERKIEQLKEVLEIKHKSELGELLTGAKDRTEIIITLLALLEMCRLGLIKIAQNRYFDTLIVWREPSAFAGGSIN